MQSITSAQPATFGLLPEPERNPTSFITSCILNSAILSLLILFGTVAHEEIQMRKMESTQIVFPMALPQIKVRPKLPSLPKIPSPSKPVLAKLEQPKIRVPVLESKPEPKLPVMKEVFTPVKMPAIKPAVVLAAQPKLALAAAPALAPQPNPSVVAVRFGDMNGVKPDPNATRAANIAALGNPYGGMQGASAAPRGVVGSTGFGNGTQSGASAGGSGGSGSYGGGKVAAAGLPSAGTTGTASAIGAITEPRDTPPVLVSHAEPLYTQEARNLKIQGEVVLRVTITVGGSMQVLGIVRGLGHGLDQSALQSAPTYRFQPATRHGQPVEYTTNIIIKFQTA